MANNIHVVYTTTFSSSSLFEATFDTDNYPEGITINALKKALVTGEIQSHPNIRFRHLEATDIVIVSLQQLPPKVLP